MSITIEEEGTLEEAVRNGATLLDELRPGWHEGVDVRTLYMGDTRHCVLGQIYGLYNVGCEAIGTAYFDPRNRRLGFNGARAWDFPVLTDAWKCEIEARRAR